MPLQNVSKDLIEKREKRAIMLAEDSFKHINQKVSHVYLHVHVLIFIPYLDILYYYIIGNRLIIKNILDRQEYAMIYKVFLQEI